MIPLLSHLATLCLVLVVVLGPLIFLPILLLVVDSLFSPTP